MATEVKDTLAPSDTSGSGVSGVDTASVEGDTASKPITEPLAVYTRDVLPSQEIPVHDTNEEILRFSIKGDLDRVVLVPCAGEESTDFQCTLQKQENSKKPYRFNFETMQGET